MESKKTKYKYAKVEGGKAIPITPEIAQKLKEASDYAEVGLYASGIAPQQEQLYRADIGIMKTHSKLIQRGATQLDLFGANYVERELERQGYPAKMGIVIDQLLLEWQRLPKDRNGFIKITRLKPLAEKLKCTPQQLKGYLVNIAGYLYPLTIRGDRDSKTGKWREITGNIQPLEMFFEYLVAPDKEIPEDDKVGTKLAYYIKHNPVKAVYIKPCNYIQRSLEKGEGYGFLYTTGNIPQLQLGWSYMAIKLHNFIYTYENNPKNPLKKIGYDKLVKHLDLEDYVKQQGNPRTIKAIKKAFETLKQDGQLERYTTPDKKAKRQMYSWVRSYKDIRQRQPNGKKK